MKDFFTFPNPINGTVARLVAGGVVILAALAIWLDQPWLIVTLSYGFVARTLAGPRLSPLALVALRVVIPLFRLPYNPVPGPPKRFSAAIGVVLSLSALALYSAAGMHGAAFGVLGVIILAAGMESLLGYCIGCRIFELMMRVGLVPESVCDSCSKWSLDTDWTKVDSES